MGRSHPTQSPRACSEVPQIITDGLAPFVEPAEYSVAIAHDAMRLDEPPVAPRNAEYSKQFLTPLCQDDIAA
jgi:hypothetical protein